MCAVLCSGDTPGISIVALFSADSAMVLNLYWIFSDATIVSIEIDELLRALLVLVCSFLFHRFQIVSRSGS